LLKTAWRSDAEIAKIVKPEVLGRREGLMDRALRNRGFRKDIDTWINPFAAPDPGLQEVTGKIAEGFNLDGNTKTGFTSPTGERGIDNNLYRVMGCGMAYRGKPFTSYLGTRAIDKMVEGLYGIVIRVSGNQDPMNDNDAVVEIGYTPDHIIKSSTGGVVTDYSFRMATSAQYTKLKATIHNGVIETESVAELHMPAFSWFEDNRGGTTFYKGRLRLTTNPDGTLAGLVGGYLDWREYYGRDTFDSGSSTGTREMYYHENQIAKYYAFKRNADGLPDPKTGQNTGISAAFRLTGVHAYVVQPGEPMAINEQPITGMPALYRALFDKASMTASIMNDPPQPRRGGGNDSTPNTTSQKQASIDTYK
jgi:hypothetical protein